MRRLRPVANRAPVPRYVLYGEMSRSAAPGFVHVETLSARSALHDWEIEPHRHDGLHQLLWIREGGGTARIDEARADFTGPALIVVPPPLVHAFVWQRGSEGHVLTLASTFLNRIGRDGEAAVVHALDIARVVELRDREAAADLDATFDRLAREQTFEAPGMTAAVGALVLLLMVAVARLSPASLPALSSGQDIWQRFRAALEARFRASHLVQDVAADLPVTRGRLDAVCRRHAGRSAQEVIHDRLIVEAQRALIYTGMTVAEIAYDLGFRDPAYFTRFFTRLAGMPPVEFRKRSRGS